MRGGQPNGAGDVGADGHEARARRDRGAPAGGRAAGVPRQSPGVAGHAVERTQAGGHEPAIRHRRLGEDRRAGLHERQRRRRVVVRGRDAGIGLDAVAVGPADDRDAVLHGHRHAVEEPHRAGLSASALRKPCAPSSASSGRKQNRALIAGLTASAWASVVSITSTGDRAPLA